MAVVKELDVIALTDHNTCKNCEAFLKVAEAYGVVALPGMELTTTEEVHVVCLFETLEDAMAFDTYVYEHLLDIQNEEAIFGAQLIMNEDDEVTGKVDKLLINATDIDFDQVAGLMEQFHGVMIPAHLEGVIVAGRCISADQNAVGTVRIMGCCLHQGEAAGYAAARCVKENLLPSHLDGTQLKKELI